MKKIIPILKLLIFIFITNFTSCKSQPDIITLPKNLDEAILYFQQKWTKQDLDSFKKQDEVLAVSELHFGVGRWIRNNWVYGERDTFFTNYFNSLGIFDADDISSIVLTSLHRTLNKKDIELDKQIETYKKYWKAISDRNEEKKIKAINTYNRFKIGDIISIYLPVDTTDDERVAFFAEFPTTEWAFNPKQDLLIKGKIIDKSVISDTSNLFFKVKIQSLNNHNTNFFMHTVKIKIGDKIELPLGLLNLELYNKQD